jgi:hypothetical protein
MSKAFSTSGIRSGPIGPIPPRRTATSFGRFQTGMQDPERVSPDNYWHVQYLLDRPGNQAVQMELFLL